MELANQKIQIVAQAIQRSPMMTTEASNCAKIVSGFADFHECRRTKCRLFADTLEEFWTYTGEESHPDPLTFQHAGLTVEIVDINMNDEAQFDHDEGIQIHRDSWSADVRINGVITTFVDAERLDLADSIRTHCFLIMYAMEHNYQCAFCCCLIDAYTYPEMKSTKFCRGCALNESSHPCRFCGLKVGTTLPFGKIRAHRGCKNRN